MQVHLTKITDCDFRISVIFYCPYTLSIVMVYSSGTIAFVADLKDVVRRLFDIPVDREIRLWNNYLNNTYECLARLKDESTLQDAGFYSGNTVVVETKKEDGSWQREDNNTKS